MTSSRWPAQGKFKQERLDLDPEFARLRRSGPIIRTTLPDGTEAWLVTGWDETRQVLSDPVFSRAAAARGNHRFIVEMDPPEHTRVRGQVISAFTHRRVQRMRSRAVRISNDLLTAMAAHGGPVDLVEALATPLPGRITCDLLGIPFASRHQFEIWSQAMLSVTAHTADEIREAQRNLGGYLADLIDRRRLDPADDLLSALALGGATEESLSDAELINLAMALVVGGFETTATQIVSFTYVLLNEPSRWARLLEYPELLPSAIEELLRYVPLGSDLGLPQIALEDVQVGEILVKAGETVVVARYAANRDEATFPDGDSLLLDRADNPHLSFGYGIHHCPGAQLARMELHVALSGLLARFPTLRLAVPEAELTWKSGLLVRGLRELPVTWT